MDNIYQEIAQRYLPANKIIVDYVSANLSELDREKFLPAFYKTKDLPKRFLDFLIRQSQYVSNIICEFGLNPNSVTKVGDFHRGNKCTLEIESDQKIFYKPISFSNTELVFWVLDLFNKFGFSFPSMELIKRTEQGYFVKEIKKDKPENIDQSLYYKHVGAIIVLTSVFRLYDMHRDNFIISRSVPVPIDCECFWLPAWEGLPPYNLAGTLLFETPANDKPLIVKGEMGVEKRMLDLKQGMLTAWDVLVEQKDNILERIRNSFSLISSRMILKPTKYYTKLLSMTFHPDIFSDDGALAGYVRDSLTGKHKISHFILEDEIRDILAYDVPYFTYLHDNLVNAQGSRILQDVIKPFDILENVEQTFSRNLFIKSLLHEVERLIH